MEQAVSNLFYGLPIHGYCALSINSIADLNDTVGGVTVTVPEDLAVMQPKLFTAGDTVTLKGELAYHFVHDRDFKSTDIASNNKRIARQKTYAVAFVNQLKQGMKEDMTLPVKLYQTAEKQMVTSIGLDQAVYLCTLVHADLHHHVHVHGLYFFLGSHGRSIAEVYERDQAAQPVFR